MRRFLSTVEQFADFELVWEWKMTAGNNSGVIYRASEKRANVWDTGPEYQILDNQGHLAGLNPLSSAGACYSAFPAACGQSNWGKLPKGHIGLQDYGGAIEFRGIKLRSLESAEK